MARIFILFLLFSSSWVHAQELTLYAIPSPRGMDWSTPRSLLISSALNRLSFKSRFMGHVFVELKCQEDYQLTGMVGKHFDYLRQLLIEGRGLAIFYHSFAGRLELQPDVEQEIKELAAIDRINFVRFKLNQDNCQRLSTYLKEYRQLNVGRYYGLANRPLYGEGAGCTAFGVSFLAAAGILDQEFVERWSQTVNIPLKYSGPPLRDEKVNLLRLLFAWQWASEEEAHQKLHFWDPDRMYQWIAARLAQPGPGLNVVNSLGAKGLEIDKSHFPAPAEPIWRKDPPATEEKTAQVP
jgi:hypothetical protein